MRVVSPTEVNIGFMGSPFELYSESANASVLASLRTDYAYLLRIEQAISDARVEAAAKSRFLIRDPFVGEPSFAGRVRRLWVREDQFLKALHRQILDEMCDVQAEVHRILQGDKVANA